MASLVKRANELEEEFVAIRRAIHSQPETAFQEFETCKRIEKELQSYGIEIKLSGEETGVIGLLRGALPGKTVALRADIDALPLDERTGLSFASTREGICHACGHDIHAAAMLACARLLSEYRDFLCGTVKFIFQPAEERLQGAQTVIQNGGLKDPKVDAIFAAHTWPDMPAGYIGVRKGSMMAGADRFRITIRAAGGHAAHPHKTADPVVVAGYLITQLQTIVSRELNPTEPAVITVGKLTAGTTANIIPSEAVLEGTVRTVSPETRTHIRASIERMATLMTQSLNAEAETEYVVGCPPLITTDALVDIVAESASQLLGPEYVLPLESLSMGSEDFAYYLDEIPGAFFRLGTYDERANSKLALHNPKLLFNERAIVTGAVTMCGVVFLYTGSDFSALL
ncbi:MAG: M20 family metallopeptidase [Oscillospiraceae bacterium]|nr:M20 family metallopeptidase [Oscillospiraceae bacterium]